MTAFRLEAFRISPVAPPILPCSPERAWIDRLTVGGGDPCPPVTLANTHGWELLVPAAFEITWNGGPLASDLTVRAIEPFPDGLPLARFALSDLGHGIVSLHTLYRFRTPPGWNLLVTGAVNEPVPGIAALTGILETDATHDPLVMHWRMMTACSIRFEGGEVFCAILPIQKDHLEEWEFAIHDMDDDPSLTAITRDGPGGFFGQRRTFGRTGGLRLNPPVDRSGTRPLLTTAVAAAAKWRPDSLLNTLDHEQNDQNIQGRARLRGGVLTASRDTAVITPADDLDPDAFDFIYQPAFLTPAECALLTETAQALAAKQQSEGVDDAFWKGRFLQFGDVLLRRPGAAALMRDAQGRIIQRLRRFYELTAPIFADTAALVRWRPGMAMDPHSDRASPDGGYHGFPHRDFGGIVYINDDYSGGELYFPRLDLVVKPTLGLLLAFTGGWHHEHAVLTVRDGDRLTMPAFYTFDPAHRERDIYGLGPLAATDG